MARLFIALMSISDVPGVNKSIPFALDATLPHHALDFCATRRYIYL